MCTLSYAMILFESDFIIDISLYCAILVVVNIENEKGQLYLL